VSRIYIRDSSTRRQGEIGMFLQRSELIKIHIQTRRERMQACGMVNNHLTSCFRYEAVKEKGKKLQDEIRATSLSRSSHHRSMQVARNDCCSNK
jgi:NurA-like 5'-3' nuclease